MLRRTQGPLGPRVRRLYLNRDVRQALEALQHRMIETRISLRLVCRHRHNRAHMTGTHSPHMQVNYRVPTVLKCMLVRVALDLSATEKLTHEYAGLCLLKVSFRLGR